MFYKYANTEIIDARMGDSVGFAKGAHRAVFNYTPKPGFLYVRSRAISSRCNDNFDMFPAEEIEKSYMTFIGKPVFVNHHNEDHRRARGVIKDAALHKDVNPDGSPDTWVELLHEVDAVTFPKLAKAILAKEVNRTSMGCDVQFSKCSVCDNVASSPLEYCKHIPGKKGKRLGSYTASGDRQVQLVFEICSGLSFFENSLLVEQPADPTAFFLGDVEFSGGLEHLGVTKSASYAPVPVDNTPVIGAPKWQKTAARTNNSNSTLIWDLIKQASETSKPKTSAPNFERITPLMGNSNVWALIHQAAFIGDDLDNNLPNFQASLPRTAKLNDDTPMENIVPAKPTSEMNDEELAAHKQKVLAHAHAWHARNPMNHQNIVDHWNAATEQEKSEGENWYADAHHASKLLAHATGTPEHAMAGLISNYSPQTHWATNIIHAAKVARTKQAIGGKGNKHSEPALLKDKDGNHVLDEHGRTISTGVPRGAMASEGQRQVGQALVDAPHDEEEAKAKGQHYEQLLKGPKTKAFARLIHTGGDDHSVVVDRHALSVAAGARASEAAYGAAGLGGKKKYAEAEGHYRQAAQVISQQEGRTIHPHQVQAATWLVRQRLNEAHDRDLIKKGARSAAAARSSIAEMHHYLNEHHPDTSLGLPGTGYSKQAGLEEPPNFTY